MKNRFHARFRQWFRQARFDLFTIGLLLMGGAPAVWAQDKPDSETLLRQLGDLRKNGVLDKVDDLKKQMLKHQEQREFENAIPLAQQIVELWEKNLGPESPFVAPALNYLGLLYVDVGSYSNAEPLFLRGLRIYRRTLGPEDRNACANLRNLGLVYERLTEYPTARSYYLEALKITAKTLGEAHPDTINSLYGVASVSSHTGNFAEAENIYHQILRMEEKTWGPMHTNTAIALDRLGLLYDEISDFAKAETLMQRSLEILDKVLGPEHRSTVGELDHLASLYRQFGNYGKAEQLFQRSLDISEKAWGRNDLHTAATLNNLGILYLGMGDYEKARRQMERSLGICKAAYGPNDPKTASAMANLAQVLGRLGKHAQAEDLDFEAFKIREKALGHNDPSTAISLNSLAAHFVRSGDYAKARSLFEEVLKIFEESFGSEHPKTATCLNNLAFLAKRQGDYAKAAETYERSLRITLKSLGADHVETVHHQQGLAIAYLDLGRTNEAIDLAAKAQQATSRNLEHMLSFTSEQQRLTYAGSIDFYSLTASLGQPHEIALALFRHKAIVLDSLLEDRLATQASGNPELLKRLNQIRLARKQLTQLQIEAPKDISRAAQQQRGEELDKLSKEVEQLEGGLAREVVGMGQTRRALKVTLEPIQAALPDGCALIEFASYNHYLGTNLWQPRYGAILLTAATSPKWITLADTEAIETDLKEYQKAVRSKTAAPELSALLQKMYRRLWQPIEAGLPSGTKRIILCPDGELSFLSFAIILCPDGEFLGQKYLFSYMATGRDLLARKKPNSSQQIEIFACTDFSSEDRPSSLLRSNGVASLRTMERSDFGAITLGRLDNTRHESETLATLAQGWHWPVTTHLDAQATEAELYKSDLPRVLHLATHGFFLPETLRERVEPDKGSRGVGGLRPFSDAQPHQAVEQAPPVYLKNPMHRSGLALAGAQKTLESWKQGQTPDMENDGIVTAEEVGRIALEGTWLVVLSACDTGTGEARHGEGVMGLRRGFIQAGTQNLLMTLWSVADRETSDFMVDFYSVAQKGKDAPKALAEVQRDWLAKLRQERGLAQAVRIAGPFIMSSQGALK